MENRYNNKLSLNKFLLEDISNFNNTKKIIISFYFNKYKNLLQYENYADKYWLISDIILYSKNQNLAAYCKMVKLYNKYISKKNTIYNQISLFWGKLSIEERNQFINIIYKNK